MAKILIVDDSRTSRKILRTILEGAGHEVIGEAVDGVDGVNKLYIRNTILPISHINQLILNQPLLFPVEALQVCLRLWHFQGVQIVCQYPQVFLPTGIF